MRERSFQVQVTTELIAKKQPTLMFGDNAYLGAQKLSEPVTTPCHYLF